MLNRRSFLKSSAAVPLRSVPVHIADDQILHCTIPAVQDYEVAATTVA